MAPCVVWYHVLTAKCLFEPLPCMVSLQLVLLVGLFAILVILNSAGSQGCSGVDLGLLRVMGAPSRFGGSCSVVPLVSGTPVHNSCRHFSSS